MSDISVYCSERNAYIPVNSLVSEVSASEILSSSKYFPWKVNGVISHQDWWTFPVPHGFSISEQEKAVAFFKRNPKSWNYRLVAMGILGDDSISPNRSTQA
jgi:hypothetical protein